MKPKTLHPSSAPRRRVLIVDDHPLTRRGMAQLLAQQDDLSVCGEAGSAAQAFTLVNSLRPDLVLVDMSLPDKPGIELIKEIKVLHPQVLILVVSMHDENLYAQRALRAGARGYLMKNEGGEKLIEALRQVLSGEVYVSHAMSARILNVYSGRPARSTDTLVSLTDREFEVFQFLGEGLTTREIGVRLHLSPKTVESHRLHMREKLGLKSGPELIRYAVRWAGSQQLI
jgi:DNA-binding NarL/FixJ family response regulator